MVPSSRNTALPISWFPLRYLLFYVVVVVVINVVIVVVNVVIVVNAVIVVNVGGGIVEYQNYSTCIRT